VEKGEGAKCGPQNRREPSGNEWSQHTGSPKVLCQLRRDVEHEPGRDASENHLGDSTKTEKP
jgi:hypothetical protein